MHKIYSEKENIIEDIYQIIEVLFKEIDISILINMYNNEENLAYGLECEEYIDFTRTLPPKAIFRTLMAKRFTYYSYTEIDNIYHAVKEYFRQDESKQTIFDLLSIISECCLEENMQEVTIKYPKVLKWRMATLKIDQDLFIADYLVRRDKRLNFKRTDFKWSSNLKTNNTNLNKILKKGIADNHYHLKGSAPSFNISWISLMNSIINRKKDFKKSKMDSNRLEVFDRGFCMKDMVLLASAIRLYLYRVLNKEDKVIEKKEFLNININDLNLRINELQEEINSERGFKETYDYMSKGDMYEGEQKLIYRCLEYIKNEDNIKFEKLFYIYLIIKSKFRGEMLQVNDINGFDNFEYYQTRKSSFLKGKQNDLLISESIISSIRNQDLKKLEARIVPQKKYTDIDKDIEKMDKSIIESILKYDTNWKKDFVDNNFEANIEKLKEKIYYVFHYPKEKDEDNIGEFNFIEIRNRKMRDKLKKNVKSLTDFREKGRNSNRVLGIDGCGSEFNCRPEVFGPAFRYLKFHRVRDDFKGKTAPNLKITYHVGEDFLDITDGLRAIEEAIMFLNMSEGDRIGHGLAMGINVREWYKFKNYKITISKQDYLDNIAWLMNKINYLNTENKFEYYLYLKEKYKKMFSEIYQLKVGSELSNDIYYLSWLLRGDDPTMYTSDGYKYKEEESYWDKCKVNQGIDCNIRNTKVASKLFYLYHNDVDVRKKGAELITVDIERLYVDIVEKVQIYIRNLVASKGISIETNPSSNYLIGTFRRYDKHPITMFYSNNLFGRDNYGHQLITSINTDDQGIFNTYLEFEYALIALALEKIKDENENPKYEKIMIYRWLDEIREMGIQQSFI